MIAHDPCAGLQLLDQPWFQLQVDVGIEKQRDDRGVAEIGQKEVFVAKRYFVRQASRAGVRAGFCNAFGIDVDADALRSDESRVGKEWVGTGRYRGVPYTKKK